MYNGKKIRELINTRGLRLKDLRDYLGRRDNSFISTLETNPHVSTLEKVADFFKVSMDEFFIRQYCNYESHEIERLRQLLEEKDGRIAALEQANRLLTEKVEELDGNK